MKARKFNLLTLIPSILVLASFAWGQGPSSEFGQHDSLYVGDGGDNTVKRFDASTGEYLGVFVTAAAPGVDCVSGQPTLPVSCIFGPRGLVFNGEGSLLVSNQNADQSPNGGILEYNGFSGKFEGAVVSSSYQYSPVAPRGIVLGEYLFVADDAGVLWVYTKAGGYVAALIPPAGVLPAGDLFQPRAVVIGPDGMLYVSNAPSAPQAPGGPPSLGGQILRYNPKNLSAPPVVFVGEQAPEEDFNRPEGLVFGPDGNLYVTSFAPDEFTATGTHTDRIQIFAGPYSKRPGTLIGHIDLDRPSDLLQERAAAQALLFGPEGFLYVPIQAPYPVDGEPPVEGNSVGEVRRYNVFSKEYTVFYPSSLDGGKLQNAWYLTFSKTDPATLAYGR